MNRRVSSNARLRAILMHFFWWLSMLPLGQLSTIVWFFSFCSRFIFILSRFIDIFNNIISIFHCLRWLLDGGAAAWRSFRPPGHFWPFFAFFGISYYSAVWWFPFPAMPAAHQTGLIFAIRRRSSHIGRWMILLFSQMIFRSLGICRQSWSRLLIWCSPFHCYHRRRGISLSLSLESLAGTGYTFSQIYAFDVFGHEFRSLHINYSLIDLRDFQCRYYVDIILLTAQNFAENGRISIWGRRACRNFILGIKFLSIVSLVKYCARSSSIWADICKVTRRFSFSRLREKRSTDFSPGSPFRWVIINTVILSGQGSSRPVNCRSFWFRADAVSQSYGLGRLRTRHYRRRRPEIAFPWEMFLPRSGELTHQYITSPRFSIASMTMITGACTEEGRSSTS